MLLLIIRFLYVLVATGAIATFTFSQNAPQIIEKSPMIAFFSMMAFALLFLVVDVWVPRKNIEIVSSIYFGLLVGFLLAFMIMVALAPMLRPDGAFAPYATAVTILAFVIMPYVSITFLLQTRDQFRFVIPYVEFARELKGGRPLILDSSALIDGRIADIVDTNVVDAQVIVPQFILHEVQDIADSHDKVRRSRGRRGLDILKRLQQDPKIEVKVQETETVKGKSVDQRLIELSKQLNGRLVTNDLNLNKLATVQGVYVVNFNDIANALKPRFIPGEHVRIRVIKEGEGYQQGIGYLDDGTMVVIENGSREIGNDVEPTVTSVLQNSAGRMLFCRLVDSPPRPPGPPGPPENPTT